MLWPYLVQQNTSLFFISTWRCFLPTSIKPGRPNWSVNVWGIKMAFYRQVLVDRYSFNNHRNATKITLLRATQTQTWFLEVLVLQLFGNRVRTFEQLFLQRDVRYITADFNQSLNVITPGLPSLLYFFFLCQNLRIIIQIIHIMTIHMTDIVQCSDNA